MSETAENHGAAQEQNGPTPVEKLFFAIKMNDMGTVMELVENKTVDVNTAVGDGITPLLYAAVSGSADCVQHLLQNGADPHACPKSGDFEGVTALHYATPDISKMRMLVNAGIDVNVTDAQGRTALVEYLSKDYAVSEELLSFLDKSGYRFADRHPIGSNLFTILLHTAYTDPKTDDAKLMASLRALAKYLPTEADCSACPMFDLKRLNLGNHGLRSPAAVAFFLALDRHLTGKPGMSFNIALRLIQECKAPVSRADAAALMSLTVRSNSADGFAHLVAMGINPFLLDCDGMNPVSYAVYVNADKVIGAMIDFAAFLASKRAADTPAPPTLVEIGYSLLSADPILAHPLFLCLLRQSSAKVFAQLLRAGFSPNDPIALQLVPAPLPLVAALLGQWETLELMVTAEGEHRADLTQEADAEAVDLILKLPGVSIDIEAFKAANKRNVVTVAFLSGVKDAVLMVLDHASVDAIPDTVDGEPFFAFLKRKGLTGSLDALEEHQQDLQKTLDASMAQQPKSINSQGLRGGMATGARQFSTYSSFRSFSCPTTFVPAFSLSNYNARALRQTSTLRQLKKLARML
jgi:hypothetical protein